jgi:multicomponent Na+:H+ antiporter subunit D
VTGTGQVLLVLPIGIPWVLAAVLAVLDGRRRWVGILAAVGLGAGFVSLVRLAFVVVREGPVEMVAGGWPEGVGITLRADPLGVTFALVSVAVILISLLYEVALGVRWRVFPALVMLVAAGLSGLFLTGDVFNFYVFFEISMVASFVLAGYREEDYQVRAAFVFAVVNLLGSTIFLSGVAALYGITGSLDMRQIAGRVDTLDPGGVIIIGAVIFAAFSLKLGLFPFHFWLPAVYVGSHAPVAAILSGALANIGGYGLLRFGAGILPRELELGSVAVLILGSASIIYGALQAISRRDTSEVMAYSAIGQVGYVILAIGIGAPVGYAAAVLYSVVNSLNKGVVFLAAGLRGPLVGGAFAVGAFSIAGVPPAAGFVGKIAVFKAAIAAGSLSVSLALVALIFVGSALSFLYSFQVYQRRFMKPRSPVEASDKADPAAARWLVVALAALVVLVGIWPGPLVTLSEAAAAVLAGSSG